MKIVYLAAGAADMFCGSCLHDNTLAAALQQAGHDALLVPTYTPLRTDEEDVSLGRVFYGGINVYLQQKSALFRHTPWVLDAMLDRPELLRWATRGSSSVDAEKLGDLTVSMLHGETGRQKKELDKLVAWLDSEERPHIVHLSNAMLLGMARRISALGSEVVCSLSGEDVFLEKLLEPYRSQARQILSERAQEVGTFVSLNHYYADYMSEYLAVPRSRIRVIPHGLNLTGHAPLGNLGAARSANTDGKAIHTIGYLARICPDKGLHVLVAACELLQADPTVPPFELRVAGYLGAGDRAYLDALRQRIARWRDPGHFQYVGEVTRDEKIAFLQSLDVFSVPTVYRESKGLPVFEAWANALPVVLPAHGTFPELIDDTQAGLLFTPEDPHSLAAALRQLLDNPGQAIELGLRGQAAVHDRYHAARMAETTANLYHEVVTARTVRPSAPVTPGGP